MISGKLFLNMTPVERAEFVMLLQQHRVELKLESKRRSAGTRKPRKKKQKITFANKELEAIFNKLPDDCKKVITGG